MDRYVIAEKHMNYVISHVISLHVTFLIDEFRRPAVEVVTKLQMNHCLRQTRRYRQHFLKSRCNITTKCNNSGKGCPHEIEQEPKHVSLSNKPAFKIKQIES